jgi:hypothetical protein
VNHGFYAVSRRPVQTDSDAGSTSAHPRGAHLLQFPAARVPARSARRGLSESLKKANAQANRPRRPGSLPYRAPPAQLSPIGNSKVGGEAISSNCGRPLISEPTRRVTIRCSRPHLEGRQELNARHSASGGRATNSESAAIRVGLDWGISSVPLYQRIQRLSGAALAGPLKHTACHRRRTPIGQCCNRRRKELSQLSAPTVQPQSPGDCGPGNLNSAGGSERPLVPSPRPRCRGPDPGMTSTCIIRVTGLGCGRTA